MSQTTNLLHGNQYPSLPMASNLHLFWSPVGLNASEWTVENRDRFRFPIRMAPVGPGRQNLFTKALVSSWRRAFFFLEKLKVLGNNSILPTTESFHSVHLFKDSLFWVMNGAKRVETIQRTTWNGDQSNIVSPWSAITKYILYFLLLVATPRQSADIKTEAFPRIWVLHCSVGTPAVFVRKSEGTIQVDQSKLGLSSPLSCFACSILYRDRFSCAFFWMHIKRDDMLYCKVWTKNPKMKHALPHHKCAVLQSQCACMYINNPCHRVMFHITCFKYVIQNNIHIKHDSRSIDWKKRVYIYVYVV